MRILGLSTFYHDSAAALVVDGQIIAAAQEERFSRKKHDSRFPHHAFETNPRFHALLTTFKEKTGCPVLVNTSFNVRGEPIVRTPEDAFRCFIGTEPRRSRSGKSLS